MHQIKSEITINAPIDIIWNTLLDFNAYQSWNPFIRKLEGNPEVGAKLVATIQPAGKKPMVFRPKILTISNYHFSWIGNLVVRGLFDGQHHFKLTPLTDSSVKFSHYESFSGVLRKPILAMIRKSTQLGFEEMNEALKNLCEIVT